MEIKKHQIFNLWDTNGRRNDILNALQIYLKILKEINESRTDEKWAQYPESLKQYLFYAKAIQASPEIFKDHPNFDRFQKFIQDHEQDFFNKKLSIPDRENLDTNIEARARHYTSNLVRLGFADDARNISSAGMDLLRGTICRDSFERVLPLSDTNIILLRQLLKLRIYSKPDSQGNRHYYNPFLMALFLLLKRNTIDKETFKRTVQGASPYYLETYDVGTVINKCRNLQEFSQEDVKIPSLFLKAGKISSDEFSQEIKNRKSGVTIDIYYEFYCALFDYVQAPNAENYEALRSFVLGKNSEKIKKAFGCGNNVFDVGTRNKPYSQMEFLEKNSESILLKKPLNKSFYRIYASSKYLDQVAEYSDTTMRLLSATGIFKFAKALPELNFRQAFQTLFSTSDLESYIFGVSSEKEFQLYESESLPHSISTLKILALPDPIPTLTSISKDSLQQQNKLDFENHIKEKYTREKTLEILRLFADRKNDPKIKAAVNEDASVPTIYEYIVAIAWYYISNETISVYDSLNLTLNGDMEPLVHASGGKGDIVISYQEYILMIEVTLMNSSAQKRGEWEPVLRHSINLNAATESKKVLTIFIADELDFNTINIWRAISTVPLQATDCRKISNKVIISAFKNEELCQFLKDGVLDRDVIKAIENSFMQERSYFNPNWRINMLREIRPKYSV